MKNKRLLDTVTQLNVQGITTHGQPLSLIWQTIEAKNSFEAVLQYFPSIIKLSNSDHQLNHNITHRIITTSQSVHACTRRLAPLKLFNKSSNTCYN